MRRPAKGPAPRPRQSNTGIEKSTMADILADPEIELIVNLTPAPQHSSIIRAALEAGKHIYTEKVITPDINETKALVALAESKKSLSVLRPGPFTFGSAWQCAREIMDGGFVRVR